MVTEKIKASGKLNIRLFDAFGNLKQEEQINNLVVDVGINFIASRLVSNSTPIMSHMSVGTNTSTPIPSNTTLGAEIAGSRSEMTASTATNVAQYSATFGPGVGTGAITEAGIFNANSAGIMLCRTSFDVVNKGVSDSMIIDWNVTVA